MTTTTLAPHELIWSLTNAGVAARCLHVAASLGVADHIDDAPVPVGRLASLCGADPDSLDRLLALLAAHGVFAADGDTYRHTAASQLLRTDSAMSMRAFPQMMGLPIILDSFAALEDAVRSGTTALEAVSPEGLWPYLEANPQAQAVFGQAMTAKAAADAAAIIAAYDFSAAGDIVDVGGGRGHLLHAVLEAAPSARGTLFDLPDVVNSAGPAHPRLIRRAGDFFVDDLPAGSTYLLMEVIHDWPDEQAVAILTAIRRAAAPGAKVLIIENVLCQLRPDPRGRTLDVIMLAVTGGRERTPAQLDILLSAAGLTRTRVIETDGPLRIVEAVATSGT